MLHHNFDKIAIQGGLVDIDFGTGEFKKPVNLFINGRVSSVFGDTKIPIKELLTQAAKDYISSILPTFEIDKWLNVQYFTNSYSHNPNWYNPRSLSDLPEINSPKANDTSTCVSCWPVSVSEQIALELEGYFYRPDKSPKFNFVGQDIKCMVTKIGSSFNITLCIPLLSRMTPNVDFYNNALSVFKKDLHQIVVNKTKTYDISININGMDSKLNHDYYILLSGSCIEAGEEGVVGRGNKTRGVISCSRPSTMEAAFGKNPVYHVGKVLGVVADEIAKKIGFYFDCACVVYISTKIGDFLYDPNVVHIESSKIIDKDEACQIVNNELSKRDWTSRILKEKLLLPAPLVTDC